MSNKIDIVETFYGTIDPGVGLEFYDWTGEYDKIRVKARFFTVAPDPEIPPEGATTEGGPTIEFYPTKLDLEITSAWNTVWVDENANATFQRNAAIRNIGEATAAYHLLRAETDN
jgi:hypothetical protein